MLAKVKQWTKNATKSIAYSSFEYIKSTAPTTASFAESNQELYKDAFHAIRDRKTTLQRTRSYFDNNQYFKVKIYISNTQIFISAFKLLTTCAGCSDNLHRLPC